MIEKILKMPTVIDNKHESLYRVTHVLDHVVKMIIREDSKDSILEMIGFLRYYEKDVDNNKFYTNSFQG